MSPAPFPHLPRESWAAYLDEALDATAASRLETHLEGCPDCRRALLEHDPSRAFRLLRVPAPAATWDGFWEELRPQLGPPAATRARRRSALWAAAAAATLLAGWLAGHAAFRRQAPETRCTEASLASLRVTREECEALFGGPIESPEEPVVVVREDLDLRGL